MRRLVIIGLLLGYTLVAFSQDSKENADFKLAVSLYNDKLFDLALEQFRQFVSTYPNTQQGTEARFYLGLTQMKLQKYEDARFTFQTFALSYPDHPKAPEAWWNVGESYAQLNNPAEAALAFERVKTFHPKSTQAPQALLRASEFFEKSGNGENARKALRALTQEYGSSEVTNEARLQLARMYYADRQYELSAAEAKRAADAAPNAPLASSALHLAAQSLAQLGKIEEAKRLLLDLIAKSRAGSASLEASLELGRLQKQGGDIEEALKTWAAITDSRNSVPPSLKQAALMEAGEALELRGRLAESVIRFENAASLGGPRAAEALSRASGCWERLGNTVKAGEYALKAVEADSSSPSTRSILLGGFRGALFLHQFQQAIRLSQRFQERFPADPLIPRLTLETAKVLAFDLNDERQAANRFEELLRDHPDCQEADEAVLEYARMLRRFGSPQEALKMLESLSRRFPASDVIPEVQKEMLAIQSFELKNKDGGLENIALLTGDVIAGKPRGDLAYRLAEIYFNDLKDYKRAAEQYLNALHSGLEKDLRVQAWFKNGRALELSQYGSTNPDKTVLSRSAAAYDSVVHFAPGSVMAGEAFVTKTNLLIRRATGISDLRTISTEMRKDAPQGIVPHSILLNLGEAYQQFRSFSDARTVYDEILNSRPNSETAATALYRLGISRFEMGEKDSAASVLRTYLSKYSLHTSTAQALLKLARLEAEKGRVDRVMEICLRLEQEFRYADAAKGLNELRGNVYYSSGLIRDALRYYRAYFTELENDLFEPRPPPLDLVLKLADCSRRTSDFAEAKKFYAMALSRDTSATLHSQIYFALAGISREENSLEAAARYLQEASKYGTSNPEQQFRASLESAGLLFEGEDYATAMSRYAELLPAAKGDSLQRLIQARIVVCFFRLDNPAEAEKRANVFVRAFPNARAEAAEFEYERGRLHLRKDETDLAVRRFENVRQRYPQAPVIPEDTYWLARTLELKNQPQRSVQLYDSLLKAFPGHPIAPRVLLSLGNVYYSLEQWDLAAKQYKVLVDGNNGTPDVVQYAMSNLIMAYKEIGLFDAALQLTRQYIERYPNDPDLVLKHIDIGVIYQKLGYYDQSILHLQKMLETANQELEGELRYYIGEAYFYKGEYQQAILEFLKVPYLITQRTKVDWVATSYYMAGQSYEKMSKFDQAITMYKQIIERAGIDPTFKAAAQKEIDRVNLLVKGGGR